MMNAADMPSKVRALPRDPRGLPIPFVVFRDSLGQPQFTINDDAKAAHCLRNDLCPICGQKLQRGRWFVGGPLSAFHADGVYFDLPMHGECVRFALKVCPYLAAPKYSKRIEAAKLPAGDAPPMIDPTMIKERPPVFVAVFALGQTVVPDMFMDKIRPHRPYKAVEYWREGGQLSAIDGAALAQAALNEFAHADPA